MHLKDVEKQKNSSNASALLSMARQINQMAEQTADEIDANAQIEIMRLKKENAALKQKIERKEGDVEEIREKARQVEENRAKNVEERI